MLDQTNLSEAAGGVDTEMRGRAAVAPGFSGVDVVVDWGGDVETLAHRLRVCAGPCGLHLATIWKDDHLMWPDTGAPAGAGRMWHCRFTSRGPAAEAERDIPRLLYLIAGTVRWTQAEKVGNLSKAENTA